MTEQTIQEKPDYINEIRYIKEQVEDYFKIEDLSIKNRHENFVVARKIYSILCVKSYKTFVSTAKIGREIKRDHATILHYWKAYQSWKTFPSAYTEELGYLKEIEKEMKYNPYTRYLGKEDILQNSVMEYIKLQYPNVFAIHVPNEGKRTPFERFKFKHLGGVAGVPDVLIFQNNAKFSGLAIELKVGSNKPTENQKECLKRLKNGNWKAAWVKSFDAAKILIDEYLRNV